jgi:DNA mismatch endonuclease (patch repair protein)
VRRTVDIAFTRQRVAVFLDGCFWHGCPEHHRAAKANREYWSVKVAGNRERDRDTTAKLVAAGWRVLRFWEHENPELAAAEVEAAVRGSETTPRFALGALETDVIDAGTIVPSRPALR